jgi:hypothetical protein
MTYVMMGPKQAILTQSPSFSFTIMTCAMDDHVSKQKAARLRSTGQWNRQA